MNIGDLVRYDQEISDIDLVGLVYEVYRAASQYPPEGWTDIIHVRWPDGTIVADSSHQFEVVSAAR